jgi:microcystin degradation protein MlrC
VAAAGSVVAYDDAVRRGMAWNTDRRAEDGALGSLVVIGDGVDATNTGAPGDSNWILRELVKYDWALAGAMCPMVSPTAVAAAAAVGEGVALAVELGGVRDTKFGGASTHDAPTPPRLAKPRSSPPLVVSTLSARRVGSTALSCAGGVPHCGGRSTETV